MESNAELARLEDFVNKLLVKYNELKDEYHSTLSTLQERDDECADLKAQITDLSSERSFVGERVAGLIGRIEQWETDELESPVEEYQEEQGEVAESDESDDQGSLFETESETP
jgi:FtsZ-binding cell division protein ZapB